MTEVDVEKLQARREEVKLIAERLRVLHKVPGGVIVIFVELHESPAGVAIPIEVHDLIAPLVPRVLREVAAKVEEGIEYTHVRSELP